MIKPWTSVPVLLSFGLVLSSAFAQTCMWKNGQDATDYYACDPTAAQSSCCLQGEACVGNSFCYGSLGIIYRGACAGGWGNDTACPQACNDQGQDGSWANLFQCFAVSAPSGASSWWCGDTSVVSPCDENGTNSNPTKAQIFSLPWDGMLPQGIMPWPSQNFTGCAVSQNNEYSVERQIENATEHNSSGSSASGSTNNTTTAVQRSCPNSAQIGEGVAIGVLALLAISMASWALYERKQKNKLLGGTGIQKQDAQQNHHQPGQARQYPQQPYADASKGFTTLAPEYQSPHRPPVSEMDSFGNGRRSQAHEMQS